MATAIHNTLLAVLLALKNLENPLSEEEGKALASVGQQLRLDPKDWDFIKDDSMAMIKANGALNQAYQQAKAKLDALDRPIPSDLLPTDEELENVLPPESEGGKRAHFEGKPDKQSNEILDLTVKVLATEKPEETAQKLPYLKRASQSLNQPNSKNE